MMRGLNSGRLYVWDPIRFPEVTGRTGRAPIHRCQQAKVPGQMEFRNASLPLIPVHNSPRGEHLGTQQAVSSVHQESHLGSDIGKLHCRTGNPSSETRWAMTGRMVCSRTRQGRFGRGAGEEVRGETPMSQGSDTQMS